MGVCMEPPSRGPHPPAARSISVFRWRKQPPSMRTDLLLPLLERRGLSEGTAAGLLGVSSNRQEKRLTASSARSCKGLLLALLLARGERTSNHAPEAPPQCLNPNRFRGQKQGGKTAAGSTQRVPTCPTSTFPTLRAPCPPPRDLSALALLQCTPQPPPRHDRRSLLLPDKAARPQHGREAHASGRRLHPRMSGSTPTLLREPRRRRPRPLEHRRPT
ncbi:hypothetical protein T484DRAFT_1929418 [Baffinella frigidus]|nr:hypothetical protein T484DRAFT_1929418 [Cryptophyta sp. CCMP2293]